MRSVWSVIVFILGTNKYIVTNMFYFSHKTRCTSSTWRAVFSQAKQRGKRGLAWSTQPWEASVLPPIGPKQKSSPVGPFMLKLWLPFFDVTVKLCDRCLPMWWAGVHGSATNFRISIDCVFLGKTRTWTWTLCQMQRNVCSSFFLKNCNLSGKAGIVLAVQQKWFQGVGAGVTCCRLK